MPATPSTADRSASSPEPRRSRRGFLRMAGAAGGAGVAVAALGLSGEPAGAEAVPSGTGAELGYSETSTPVGTGTSVALPNLALVVPVGDGPVAVEYGGYVQSTAAGGLVKLYLMRDGKPVHEVGCTVAGAGGVSHLLGRCRIPAGELATATFTVLLANWTTGATVRVLAMPLSPAFVQAHRL